MSLHSGTMRKWQLVLPLAILIPLNTANAAFHVRYTFTGGSDGSGPSSSLIFDNAGNLYGTTQGGGANRNGTVFKLTPSGTETVLYSFKGGNDGADPFGGVIADKAGNLYGTTYSGGGNAGCGIVFKLAPDGTESVLHVFGSGRDGCNPWAGVVMDAAGNLYGTTVSGGGTGCSPYGCGTVFKIATDGTETVLHAFADVPDGANPYSPLLMDKAGNLYGTTEYGGTNLPAGSVGTVFKIAPDGTESVLHAFDYTDGSYPTAGLIMDKAGNLFGTTAWGSIIGAVFKLAPDGTETVLHTFTDVPDGA